MSRRRPETPPERKPLHSYPAPDVPDREPLSLLEQQRRAAPRRPHYLWGNRFDPEPPPKAIPPTQQNKDTTPDTDWSEKQKTFQGCLFAKSCKMPYGSIQANTRPEPLTNFGGAVLLGGTVAANTQSGAVVLGEMANTGRVLSALGSAVAAVGTSAASLLVLAFVPANLFDGTQYDADALAALPQAQTRARFGITAHGHVFGVHTAPDSDHSRVPTYPALSAVDEHGQKTLAVELDGGVTLTWYPDGGALLPYPDVVFPERDEQDLNHIQVHPIPEIGDEIFSDGFPGVPENNVKDAIIYFPDRPDIPPLYIVYKTTKELRAESGVATGKGKDVDWEDGYWLGKAANEGQGQYIPTVIADALRGREFKNFDDLRKAIWLEVYNNPELMKQFASRINQDELEKGNAPICRKRDQAGKRVKYEIHHVAEVQHGGNIYDIDNLRINTAKNHIRIHSNEK